MSTIIGADATKLVGLQIDTLNKYRAGQLSPEHWERFLNLTPEAREERFGDGKKPKPAPIVESSEPPVQSVKFAELADLGIVTVLAGYNHATQLDMFMKENRKKFYDVNKNITDANFPNPSRILKPGDKLRVRAFQQIVGGSTTSEERMKFLVEQKCAVYVGAQGASLVFEQKRAKLPKGKWYASFDEKDRLWEDAVGGHRVPCLCVYSDGGFRWCLGYFEYDWSDNDAFFGFSDIEQFSGT